jgi:hypothetical protein
MSLRADQGEERGDRPGVVGEPGVSPPAAAHSYHVGNPPTAVGALRLVRAGLPVYWPTDPKDIDQRPYLAFAEKRPPNSE